METSARHGLPLLSAGQAQKEYFHNEAIQALDFLVGPAVFEGPSDQPPATPQVGGAISSAMRRTVRGKESRVAWRDFVPAAGVFTRRWKA